MTIPFVVLILHCVAWTINGQSTQPDMFPHQNVHAVKDSCMHEFIELQGTASEPLTLQQVPSTWIERCLPVLCYYSNIVPAGEYWLGYVDNVFCVPLGMGIDSGMLHDTARNRDTIERIAIQNIKEIMQHIEQIQKDVRVVCSGHSVLRDYMDNLIANWHALHALSETQLNALGQLGIIQTQCSPDAQWNASQSGNNTCADAQISELLALFQWRNLRTPTMLQQAVTVASGMVRAIMDIVYARLDSIVSMYSIVSQNSNLLGDVTNLHRMMIMVNQTLIQAQLHADMHWVDMELAQQPLTSAFDVCCFRNGLSCCVLNVPHCAPSECLSLSVFRVDG